MKRLAWNESSASCPPEVGLGTTHAATSYKPSAAQYESRRREVPRSRLTSVRPRRTWRRTRSRCRQPVDFVRPDVDTHLAPGQLDLGVVVLLLGEGADPVDERDRLLEIGRRVRPGQPPAVEDLPAVDLRQPLETTPSSRPVPRRASAARALGQC